MSPADLATVSALLAVGLVAGLMYGWVVSVIPGHRRLDDRAYLLSMQHINRAIVNPGFVVPFIATLPLAAAATWLEYRTGEPHHWWWPAAGTVSYGVGMLGVTAAGNIPLNNDVEALDIAAMTPAELATARAGYEPRWNQLHNFRTAAGVAAFVLFAVATSIR